ncbi:MAG TPA: type IV toxin-antitoxin system AbiEi family antitoxin domain-containing protein [Thermoplasmata archaeon]|nr:type IV toxin-antitoxin system AbiEi family antitoxin domain-containing protein [Thermoplasmata archaeon]
MALPTLVQKFREQGCFTLQEADALLGPRRGREAVKYLWRAGYITTVRRGLYALLPEKTGSSPDRYVLASKASADSVMSYHTALELLGVAQTAMFKTIYVRVPRRVAAFTHEGINVRPLDDPLSVLESKMVRKLKRSGASLQVAGRELALCQCAERPEYAGGVEELVKSVEGFSQLDLPRLERLLDSWKGRYGWASMNAKLGYLAERNAKRWRCPEGFLERLNQRVPKAITYFGIARGKGGRWVRRWNLVIPPGVLGGGT